MPDGLAQSVSPRLNERSCLRNKVQSDRGRRLPLTFGLKMHAYTTAAVHICTTCTQCTNTEKTLSCAPKQESFNMRRRSPDLLNMKHKRKKCSVQRGCQCCSLSYETSSCFVFNSKTHLQGGESECWLVFNVDFTRPRAIYKEGTSNEKEPP